jgi:hypothetical protein
MDEVTYGVFGRGPGDGGFRVRFELVKDIVRPGFVPRAGPVRNCGRGVAVLVTVDAPA